MSNATSIASVLLLVAACAADDHAPDDCAQGRCDGDAEATAVSCWIEPGAPGDDPVFVFDAVVCSLADPFYRASISAIAIRSAGERLVQELDRPVEVARFPSSEYPVSLRVTLMPHSTPFGIPGQLTLTHQISESRAATPERPLAWKAPFSVGELIVDSHVAGDLNIQYSVDLAPFADNNGQPTFSVARNAQVQYGTTRRFTLPVQGPIAATVGARTLEFSGAGRYSLTEEAVVASAGVAGDEVVTCRAGARSDSGHPIYCTLVTHPLMALSATARLGETSASLASGVETLVGNATWLPASVLVHARMAAPDGVTLDAAIRGRRVGVQLAVGAEEPAVGRMGFSAWLASVSCVEASCDLTREEVQLPFSFQPELWGTSAAAATVGVLAQDETRTFVFASDPAARDLAATVRIDENATAIRLRPGSFTLSRAGLNPVP